MLADRVDRAMKQRLWIVARAVSDGADSQILSEHDPARLDALRAALQVDCVSPATRRCGRIILFLDIYGSEGRLTLGLDAEDGRVEVGDDGWAPLLCEPRRIFRWLSERGVKGLSRFV